MRSERLRPAQTALLSFDQHESDVAWLGSVARSLTLIAQTEQVYYTGPTIDNQAQSREFLVAGAGIDECFKNRIHSDFQGYRPNGDSEFAEDYSTFLHQTIRKSGPCVIHDAPLFDERKRKEMILHCEAFDPAGILRQLALNVPRTNGESLMIFGYADGAQPDQDSDTFRDLERLLPVWERALRLKQCHGTQAYWQTGIDLLPTPIIVASEAGPVYANRAFELLSLSAQTRSTLAAKASAMAQRLLRALTQDELAARQGFELPVNSPEGMFRLLARLDLLADAPMVLISVEPQSALPPASFLVRSYRLSPRERQALALMIAGHGDKEIERAMGVSFHTARQYTANVLRKVGSSRASLRADIWAAFLAS